MIQHCWKEQPEMKVKSYDEIKDKLLSLLNREYDIQKELEEEQKTQKYVTNKSLALSQELKELPGFRKGLLYAINREDL